MATNFKFTAEKAKHTQPSNYVIEREYKAERRKVMEVEKELKAHEQTDAAHAHPMHRSHETQPDAPLPSMRK
jgi:hypothetical protein